MSLLITCAPARRANLCAIALGPATRIIPPEPQPSPCACRTTSAEQSVLADELMIERRQHMQDNEAGEQERNVAVGDEGRIGGKAFRQWLARTLKNDPVEAGK